MQKVLIPLSVDPVRNSGKQLSFDGYIPSKNLPRFNEVLASPCSDIEVTLWFGTDEQKIHNFRGQAKANVELTCQRCGGTMPFDLAIEFQYAPVTKRQTAEDMPEHYEAAELNELGEVLLHPLVEDELLLALPIVAKHTEQDCAIKSDTMSYGELPAEAEKPNPFAVLQKLKK
ncbi:Putative metal-binding protein, possibly nucleic-acid binding protein [Idiomarina sp. A28L]|uniref:23S rRNA accumulation protein YceD n=1 Tax=Idiomarina sp. A28L TaxID=1036674 RepID=UPI0002138A8B|nr:23S rRNA accumulation protein YceD [Idiomarina sp. A28L]EGN75865.1 Putative metal-binding protein, possibly nucleic-acid binding protein [Idiomarina sp. A28L]